jgi:non-heme chloroperoxidase
MSTITVKDGTEIYYKDWGKGQPVVFSHGWPLNADAWDAQMFFLGHHGYRVIAHDRRGHGRSGQTWDGNEMNTYADDLAVLFETLDLKNAVMVGHSTGGGEVARYLGRHGSGRVARAVLISSVTPYMLKTGDNPDGVDQTVFDGMVSGIEKDRAQFFIDFAPGFYGNTLLDKKASEGVLQWTLMMAMQGSPKATIDCARAFSETDFRKDLEGADVPFLIIHGKDDKTVPIDVSARKAAKLIKDVRLIEYDGEAHGLTTTAADKVNQNLINFITG